MSDREKLLEMQVADIEKFIDNDGLSIPEHMAEGLAQYFVYGRLPGDFLRAILGNHLMDAFGYADSENKKQINTYVEYLYNQAPIGSYGTKSNVLAWSEMKRAES